MRNRPSRERHARRWWNRKNGKRLSIHEMDIARRSGFYPGDRVGAIMSDGRGPARSFGVGTYTGCRGGSPVILLDSGETVFGYECWWTDEEGHRAAISDAYPDIEPITVAEARARWEKLFAEEAKEGECNDE